MGSVFPYAVKMAVPCMVLTVTFKGIYQLSEDGYSEGSVWLQVLKGFKQVIASFSVESSAYQAFSGMLGFLVIFLTSQSYNRYWDGCTLTHQMMGQWYDSCSSLLAFAKMSTHSEFAVEEFQHTCVRLFSMLHALALSDLEDISDEDRGSHPGFDLELIDARVMDHFSLLAIKQQHHKVELVFHWLQSFIVKNQARGLLNIPAPILTRSFQEMGQGMLKFHEALKIAKIPFPLPYTQAAFGLLVSHWVVTPLIMCTSTTSLLSAGLFSSIQVCVLWSLYALACELENPFGHDAYDLDIRLMQRDMNQRLLLLVHPDAKRSPELHMKRGHHPKDTYVGDVRLLGDLDEYKMPTFNELWDEMGVAILRTTMAGPAARDSAWLFGVATRENSRNGSAFRPTHLNKANSTLSALSAGEGLAAESTSNVEDAFHPRWQTTEAAGDGACERSTGMRHVVSLERGGLRDLERGPPRVRIQEEPPSGLLPAEDAGDVLAERAVPHEALISHRWMADMVEEMVGSELASARPQTRSVDFAEPL